MAGARPGDLPDDVVQEDSGSHGDVQRGDVSAHGQADQEVTVFTDEPAQSPSLAPHHDGERWEQMGVVIQLDLAARVVPTGSAATLFALLSMPASGPLNQKLPAGNVWA